MTNSKMIQAEIEKLEKNQEELKKKLSLLKNSKEMIEKVEESEAGKLFYNEVNDLVSAANLNLLSETDDSLKFSMSKDLEFIYLHQSTVNYSDFWLARLFLDGSSVEEVSKWIDLILDNVEILNYLLTFKHENFDFNDLDVDVEHDILKAYFVASDNLSLNISFFEGNTALVSMSNYIDRDLKRFEIDAEGINYLVESEGMYDLFSVSASIKKNCQLHELNEVIEGSFAKLKNCKVSKN